MEDLQKKIFEWSQKTFNHPDMMTVVVRGNKEMSELISSVHHKQSNEEIAEECADVAFFLLQLCEMVGHDLHTEIEAKFEKNKQRQWSKGNDGSYQHVKEG